MARIEVLKLQQLTCHEALAEELDKNLTQKFLTFEQRFGYFGDIPIVCLLNSSYNVLKGESVIKLAKLADKSEIACVNIGELSEREFFINRILLASRETRLNYINIAKLIRSVGGTKRDVAEVATITHLPVQEVQHYYDLLEFDWEAFLKEEIVIDEQLNLFDI